MNDNICTYCGQRGHRASNSPRRIALSDRYFEWAYPVTVIVCLVVLLLDLTFWRP